MSSGGLEVSFSMCSKTKGADQLCDYRAANLGLCFRICKKQVFLYDAAHIVKLLHCIVDIHILLL